MKKLYLLFLFFIVSCLVIAQNDNESEPEYPYEILQTESTAEHYFKIVIDKKEDDYYPRIYGVRIFDINTNDLLQELELDCQFWNKSSVEVFDYNFDGIDDFSVFEASYAGPNTSRVHILSDPKSASYFISNITGVSLQFDSASKTISEYNQCCAGSSVWTAVYKLENNEMVMIEEHCYKRNEDTDEMEEKPVSECK